MSFRRLLLSLLVCAAVGGAFSGRALAVTIPLPGCSIAGAPNTLVTPHFRVGYTSDPGQTNYISETQAGDIGGWAEHAYAAYQAMGFPAPMTSGVSGKIDIAVTDLTTWSRASVVCPNGAFDFDPKYLNTVDKNMFTIGAAVFAQVEYAQFVPPAADMWLTQAASQWASAMTLDYPQAAVEDIGPPDMALDCWDPNYTITFEKCQKDLGLVFDNIALSRWPFFEYLSEKYGPLFIDEVLADSAGAGSGYTGLTNALAAHGTTLSAAYNAWTAMDLAGTYTAPSLHNLVPASYTKVPTGVVAATVANKLRVPVNHLSTRYIEFDRGDGVGAAACFAATLTLSVAIPAGSLSQPVFYWTGTRNEAGVINGAASAPVPLAVNGNTATASIPWDTCTWSGAEGLLSLPNASSNPDLNAANFYVTAAVTAIDPNSPANPGAPSTPVTVWGQVVPVTSASVPPAITMYGRELLTLSPADHQLRFIIESSAEGSIQVVLGSTSLGTVNVVPGTNAVAITLPASVLLALRRSAGTGNVLTVTPVSSSGVTQGQPETRKVQIAPATKQVQAKPKPAAKPKAKPKTKRKSGK
jgi:hypothetical protein